MTIDSSPVKFTPALPGQPVPEIRTFGALMAHVAGSQLLTCSTINGRSSRTRPSRGRRHGRW